MSNFVYYLASFLAVAFVITTHEYAHADAADKSGDPTPRLYGRLTLNPAKHFDLLGVVMFAVAGFGWAKPVPINPNNFNNYRKGCFWTSVAGVLINYLMAFVFYPILILVVMYVCPIFEGTYMAGFIEAFFYSMFACSLSFCVFNLLPLYPLDGFRIVDALNKKRGKVYRFLRDKGYYVLLGLIAVHFLADKIPMLWYIDVLGYVLSFAVNILGRPITLFWGWILQLILG